MFMIKFADKFKIQTTQVTILTFDKIFLES